MIKLKPLRFEVGVIGGLDKDVYNYLPDNIRSFTWRELTLRNVDEPKSSIRARIAWMVIQ